MDGEQQRKINEAAEKFAEAVCSSYQSMSGRATDAQEISAQLTQSFFDGVVSNLQAQSEGNQALARDVVEQQLRQQAASREMIQRSMNSYNEFLNSMFEYQQWSLDQIKDDARDSKK